jgi:hypothetical protein
VSEIGNTVFEQGFPGRLFHQRQGRQFACTALHCTTLFDNELTLLSCYLQTRAAQYTWSCSRQSNDYSSIEEFDRNSCFARPNAFCATSAPKTWARHFCPGRRGPARERSCTHLRLFQPGWVVQTVRQFLKNGYVGSGNAGKKKRLEMSNTILGNSSSQSHFIIHSSFSM